MIHVVIFRLNPSSSQRLSTLYTPFPIFLFLVSTTFDNEVNGKEVTVLGGLRVSSRTYTWILGERGEWRLRVLTTG